MFAFLSGAQWTLVAITVVMVTGMPVCERPGQFIQNRTECSIFYMCGLSGPVQKSCPSGLVFSQKANVCVWPRSGWDDCTAQAEAQAQRGLAPAPFQATPAPATPRTPVTPPPPTQPRLPAQQLDSADPCRVARSGIHMDGSSCSRYFNCSLRRSEAEPFLGLYSQECPYGQLLDSASMACRPARVAQCGRRPYSKHPCDWVENMCAGPHCRECASRMVDCTALRDGVQPYPGREDTPYYIRCQDGWFRGSDLCPQDADGHFMRFSAQAGACVSFQ